VEPQDEVLLARVGQTIAGRWLLNSLIGSGGMAAVYAATSISGQTAALKILYPEMGIRKEIRERFLREAAVMARIVHPGMVTIYEQSQSGDLAYLAMELLHGETVAARVRRLGRLAADEVLAILDQILDVLNVAHALGIVHRDLKPENLFLTLEGRLKVLDFGLARLLDGGTESFRTRTGAALGTLPYMAPEQALGRRDDVDARTDLFAVGATAYRLLSGRRIHEAPSEAELLMCMASEPAKPLLTIAPDLSPDLAAVVDRALAFAKTRRYPDAATMQRDVRALLAGQAPEYASAWRDRDEAATSVDRRAPPAGDTAPLPGSTRPLYAALPLGSHFGTQTANDPAVAAGEPLTASLASRRVLPATVAMPASVRGTVPDPTPIAALPTSPAIIAASIPLAPLSDTLFDRQRRRTFAVGLSLLLGMLAAATATAWYFLGHSSHAPGAAAAATSAPEPRAIPQQNGSRVDAVPMTRHPEHVMTPDEDTALPRSATPHHAIRSTHASAASPAVPSSPPTALPSATLPSQVNFVGTSAPPVAPAPTVSTPPAAAPGPPLPLAQPSVAPPAPIGVKPAPTAGSAKPRGHGKKQH